MDTLSHTVQAERMKEPRITAALASVWQVPKPPARRLFRRIALINGTVFTLGTLVLALSPATVSARIELTEIPVLLIGVTVMLIANALLLKASLSPLDRLADSMGRVDPPRRSDRLLDHGDGDLHQLITAFNAMLDRLESERSSARAAALSAQENERQRIARELHDEIGQSLTVALLTLKRAADCVPADALEHVESAQDMVRMSLDEVRDIATRLRPDTLDELGLSSALHTLCGEFTRASGIDVARHIVSPADCLDPEIELVCYRIAQESLTNIARHSGAKEVWIDMGVDDEKLTLTVGDDGTGGVVFQGAGISGMLERALLVNSTLSITSPQGQGTEVRLEVPLKSQIGGGLP